MRILFVNPIGSIGGAERVMLDSIASIRAAERGHEIHALLMQDGHFVSELQALGVNVKVIPMPDSIATIGDSALKDLNPLTARATLLYRGVLAVPAMWDYVMRVRHAVREVAPDVVHSNGLKSHLALGFARVRIPTIWHIHDFVGSRPVVAAWLRRVCRDVTPLAISNAVAADIRDWLPAWKPVVIPNGIDVDHFSPGAGHPERLDREAHLKRLDDGAIRVGLVATYARWKGQEVFLRAARKVIDSDIDETMRFYIVGGPIYTTRGSQYSPEELQQLIDELKLNKQAGLIPFQEDTAGVYRSLDIVVHASTRPEPFGLTIAEAMSCARPVIASKAGGAAELFTDGTDALGVPPGNVDKLAAAIARLIKDPMRRSRMAMEARQTAIERFDRRRLGPALLALYRRLA
jgi:glycosyltransferase involved in cell wall biosynthesis